MIMNQGPRLILAFVLSMVIMFVYYTFIAPPHLPHPPQKVADTAATTPPPHKETPPTATAQPTTPKDTQETLAEAKDINIETPVSRIGINTRGGVLTSYELKKYRREANSNSPQTNLLTDTAGSTALHFGLKGYAAFNDDKVYEVMMSPPLQDGMKRISLLWQNSEIRVEKTLTFGALKTDYAVAVDYLVTNLGGQDLKISPYLESRVGQKPESQKNGGLFSFLKLQQPDTFNRFFYKDDSLTTKMDWDSFQGQELESGNISWAAVADRYFLIGMMPPQKHQQNVMVQFSREDNLLVGQIIDQEVKLSPGGKTQGRFMAYLGPKELAELQTVGGSLEKAVDYGWFSFLARPILWLMTFLHGLIPSWGLVIIVLTFIIKLLLHPVNKKSMESMKGMQQLQPKLKEIKDKFADDKERQNKEVMQLFKTHKVNPMGGCLPMLLQMPIYIVLYKVLWNAIELYHAPFMGIYQDLSAPDPYFISPILLGVFMFLQQKLTPSATVDPAQQKMMMFMPIMFTALMLFLPVGLVIYIFVNTTMSVIQQFMMKREISFKQLVSGHWHPKGT